MALDDLLFACTRNNHRFVFHFGNPEGAKTGKNYLFAFLKSFGDFTEKGVNRFPSGFLSQVGLGGDQRNDLFFSHA